MGERAATPPWIRYWNIQSVQSDIDKHTIKSSTRTKKTHNYRDVSSMPKVNVKVNSKRTVFFCHNASQLRRMVIIVKPVTAFAKPRTKRSDWTELIRFSF